MLRDTPFGELVFAARAQPVDEGRLVLNFPGLRVRRIGNEGHPFRRLSWGEVEAKPAGIQAELAEIKLLIAQRS